MQPAADARSARRPIEHIAGDVPADIATRARQGTPPTLLPYLAQDDYGRRLEPRPHRVAVLESDALRATVALDLGGRLLSLFDRRADRELLYVNPVVQPANLALRNAWFSGGVEWNIGTRGHSPTTMDTLHAAAVEGPDGEPMLRLWEWERLRGVVFQVDLWMPPSSAVLLAHIRIRNLNDIADADVLVDQRGGRRQAATPACSLRPHGRSAPSTRTASASPTFPTTATAT